MNRCIQDASVTEKEYTDSVYTCQEESTKFVSKEIEKNPVHVEIGSKLWKFQQELEITQEALGARFSTKRKDKWGREFSKRMIQGYESGENELSAELLFNIWKDGYSVDDIFAECPQSSGKARELKDTARSYTAKEAIDRVKDFTIRTGSAELLPEDDTKRTVKVKKQDPRALKQSPTKKHRK